MSPICRNSKIKFDVYTFMWKDWRSKIHILDSRTLLWEDDSLSVDENKYLFFNCSNLFTRYWQIWIITNHKSIFVDNILFIYLYLFISFILAYMYWCNLLLYKYKLRRICNNIVFVIQHVWRGELSFHNLCRIPL